MKRRNYVLRINGADVATKHAWNATRREMYFRMGFELRAGEYRVELIREIDLERGLDGHVFGRFIWQTNKGREIMAEIERER